MLTAIPILSQLRQQTNSARMSSLDLINLVQETLGQLLDLDKETLPQTRKDHNPQLLSCHLKGLSLSLTRASLVENRRLLLLVLLLDHLLRIRAHLHNLEALNSKDKSSHLPMTMKLCQLTSFTIQFLQTN